MIIALLLLTQALSESTLVNALRSGGYVIVMRHASSPREVPDKPNANPDNSKLERQLDEAGRSSAIAMGTAIRDLKIPIAEVFSSPTYRAMGNRSPRPIPQSPRAGGTRRRWPEHAGHERCASGLVERQGVACERGDEHSTRDAHAQSLARVSRVGRRRRRRSHHPETRRQRRRRHCRTDQDSKSGRACGDARYRSLPTRTRTRTLMRALQTIDIELGHLKERLHDPFGLLRVFV